MSTTRERYIEWRTRSLLPQLPIEIWSHIASYLNVDELFSLRLVSRLFHACVNHYTHFWSSVILDLDRCSIPLVEKNRIQHIRLSKLDLVTRSNLYAHCSVDFIGLSLSATKVLHKRPRRRLFTSADQQEFLRNTPYLRCSSISFQTLRLFGPAQLEHLLQKRVRRLAFSYQCQTFEPSVLFLLKLRHLKYLRITFTHNINAVDAFARMLINTMRNVILVLFRLKRLRSLTLHNLYLTEAIPESSVYCVDRLRSIWFEDCTNIHFLLPSIDKQHLKHVILRQSTCDRTSLTDFLNQLTIAECLDLSSIQMIDSPTQTYPLINIPPALKQCTLHSSMLPHCSHLPQVTLQSLELIDIDTKLLALAARRFQSLQILCLFFTSSNPHLTPLIGCLSQNRLPSCRIHFHVKSINDVPSLPPNMFIVPLGGALRCFRYENLM